LSVLRDIQTRFNTDPPIPAKILAQMEEKKAQEAAGRVAQPVQVSKQYSLADNS
jgi:hypothetical protein